MWILGNLFSSTPTMLYTIDNKRNTFISGSLFKNRPLKDSMDNSTPYMRENNKMVKEIIEGTYLKKY